MDFKYNEKTGTTDIEAWLVPVLRGLAKLKCDITIRIKYEAEPESTKEPLISMPIKKNQIQLTKNEELLPPVLSVSDIQKFLGIGGYKPIIWSTLGSFIAPRLVAEHSFLAPHSLNGLKARKKNLRSRNEYRNTIRYMKLFSLASLSVELASNVSNITKWRYKICGKLETKRRKLL
ncbi:hypothetical protein AB4Z29_25010 [Paenibacillus sp. 2TAB23]|uniref:hypothetical protein n=1 Tax=Paenibacillus sp. 2TAB23 TaxID=3233004 RepID=UPI003F99DA2E